MGSASWIRFPAPWPLEACNLAATTQNCPTQNDGVALVMTAQGSDTITDVGFRQGVTTGTPAAGSYTAEVQTVGTTGNPSGSLAWVGGTATFTPAAANDGKWIWVTLGTSGSVTQGDQIALVVFRNAATDAANKITATYGWNDGGTAPRFGMPTPLSAAAGVWTKRATFIPVMGMKSGTTCYGYPINSLGSITSNAFGSTTEAGMLFTVPSNFCSTYKVAGIRALILTPSAAKTFVASLYAINGSRVPQSPPTQATGSIDSDDFSAASSGVRLVELYFTALVSLTAGTQYAIGLATTTASDSSLYSSTVQTASDWDAWPGQQQTSYTSRTVAAYPPAADATAFAAGTTTQRPMIELILADLTAPTGGAGGNANILRGSVVA